MKLTCYFFWFKKGGYGQQQSSGGYGGSSSGGSYGGQSSGGYGTKKNCKCILQILLSKIMFYV